MSLKEKVIRFRKEIFASIRGTDYDFTSGSIGKAVFLLSIPMILEMVMESVFVIVDIFFVSKLGADAVSVVGLTESMMSIVFAIAIGLSTSTTALISRRIGEKNSEGANNTALQAILLTVLVSLFISIIGIAFDDKLLRLMGASDEVTKAAGNYTALMFGGNTFLMLLFVINAVFRSAGDAAISMRVLWIANGINILLDPCLIFGLGVFPELGVSGAAVATNIGRGIAVAYQLYLLFAGSRRIKIGKENVFVNPAIIKKLIKLSLGGVGQNLITTSGWIILVRIIATFGSVAVAGYTIAIRILIFSILPAQGISNAAATLTGQNLGANKPARAEKSIWITVSINMIFLSSIAILLISFPENWIKIFIKDALVIEKGAVGLKYISIALFAYSIGMVLVQAFNGSGKTHIPTILNFICFWVIEIPIAYFLALKTDFGERGVYIAIIVGDASLAIIGLLLFLRGSWKLSKI